jgi:hypothetical protein
MTAKKYTTWFGFDEYTHFTDFFRKVDAMEMAKMLRKDYGSAKVRDGGKGARKRWSVFWRYTGDHRMKAPEKIPKYREIQKRMSYL